jgi:hypothetical protein
MKIRFEGLLVQDLLQVSHSPVQHILVRLVVSNAEMVTEPYATEHSIDVNLNDNKSILKMYVELCIPAVWLNFLT